MSFDLVTTQEQLELYLANLHSECKEAARKHEGIEAEDEDTDNSDCDLYDIAKPLIESEIFDAMCLQWLDGEHPLTQLAAMVSGERFRTLLLHILSCGIKIGWLIAHPEQAVIEHSLEEIKEAIEKAKARSGR